MKTSSKFEDYYRKLNSSQKEAVDAIEGPVMVIAGPGTGKTQILTLRIANILRLTDTSPDSILALTFTTSGVYSMRRRLVEIVGSAGYRVKIATFHSFCNDVIRDFPEEFPDIISAGPATEADQIRLMKGVIENMDLEWLKPFGDTFYYLKPSLAEIARLKRENISPSELAKVSIKSLNDLHSLPDLYYQSGAHKGKMKGKYKDLEKSFNRNKELAVLYDHYQRALAEERLYDFGDMILTVIRRLEDDPDLLLRLQEEYQYVLADEHQDANASQNRLLELLSSFHTNPNLFIVGDEKQAIFQFQGASLDNFDYFLKLYPQAQKISLKKNYRSGQKILDVAHSLIGHSGLNKENIVALKSDSGVGDDKIKFREFPLTEKEFSFLVDDIEAKIKAGVSPDHIAVLYRNNKEAQAVVTILENRNLPVVVESDQDVLEDREIAKLILLLRAIDSFGREDFLFKVLHFDLWSVDPLDIYKLMEEKNKTKVHLIDLIRDKRKISGLQLKDKDKIYSLLEKIENWHHYSKNKTLLQSLELIIFESGFMVESLSSSDKLNLVQKLRTFFNQAKSLSDNDHSVTLSDFLKHLDLLLEHGVSVNSETTNRSGIRLMTAHKSKGLEFDYVYIINFRDGHWGNKRRGKLFSLPIRGTGLTESDLDDERRLFYVALTRAKKEINISFSASDAGGRSFLPSVFLEEINPELVERLEVSDFGVDIFSTDISEKKSTFASSRRDDYLDFVNQSLTRQGLSVSGLNNYLTCPWQYFFVNLLRLPKAKTKHACYGTAVHEALFKFFKLLSNNKPATKEDLLFFFAESLKRENLTLTDFDEAKKKGEESLGGYFETYKDSWLTDVLLEFRIKGIELYPGVKLTGVLDKIEILPEGKVRVVDYKTGQPKSRNQIEGLTKNSNGNFKRQLVFYKLLLNHYENGQYNMIRGKIDFVEPDKKTGRYRQEEFEITDSEVKELEGVVIETIEDILNLSFWGQTCDQEDCEYCRLRRGEI